jgi:hypothetical protein
MKKRSALLEAKEEELKTLKALKRSNREEQETESNR